MVNNKILGLLGLSAKAGKICFGADSVETEIKKKKVNIVIVAQDSSDRTKNKFEKICKENHIKIIIFDTIENISKSIGKSNKAIIGIKDQNLASQIEKICDGGDSIGKNKNT